MAPIVIDTILQSAIWRGKNVKNDELDLQVPMHDVGACFSQKGQFINVLTYENKLRVYDIRGTQRRPVKDDEIKGVAPRSKMSKLASDSSNELYLYAGNDMGEILQLDTRKDCQMVGKFKGITTSISGIAVGQGQLVSSSMDSYVRMYDLE